MIEHIVKCWPQYWEAVKSGEKNFAVRRDDRSYQRGDILVLRKTEAEGPHSFVIKMRGHVDVDAGQWRATTFYDLRRRITYVLIGGKFGIEPGYVVLGLAPESTEVPA